jgi:hypothetical protein
VVTKKKFLRLTGIEPWPSSQSLYWMRYPDCHDTITSQVPQQCSVLQKWHLLRSRPLSNKMEQYNGKRGSRQFYVIKWWQFARFYLQMAV